MRSWQEKASKTPPFIYSTFRPSPIRNKNQESRKRHHPDRNNSQPDIRRGTSQKPPHTNRKRPRQRPRLHDVVSYDKTSRHPFLLPRRNQQKLKHNEKEEPTHRLLPGVARRLPPQLNGNALILIGESSQSRARTGVHA